MTEPDVASSDATNIATRIVRDGDEYVINGRKWWTSGAMDPRCALFIVMGKTDPDAAGAPAAVDGARARATPRASTVVRDYPVFGHQDQHGHAEVVLDDVRVPVTNLLGEEGGGFATAQARLGPGRIHHCMRALGAAERALALMVRAGPEPGRLRQAAGRAGRGARADRASPGIEIDQARLLCHQAATVDRQHGQQGGPPPGRAWPRSPSPARPPASSTGPSRCTAAPASPTTPRWPAMYGWHRAMRLFDGPDEVHLRSIAKAELRRSPILPPGAAGRLSP